MVDCVGGDNRRRRDRTKGVLGFAPNACVRAGDSDPERANQWLKGDQTIENSAPPFSFPDFVRPLLRLRKSLWGVQTIFVLRVTYSTTVVCDPFSYLRAVYMTSPTALFVTRTNHVGSRHSLRLVP